MMPLPAKSQRIIRTSAPGRICLFGEHQDYLGLPVIAAAIDLRVEVAARHRPEPGFVVNLPDIGETVVIDPSAEQPYRHGRDYLTAAVNVLRREGLTWPEGYEIAVRSDIPINSGASSSSALQVAWCAFLLEAAGDARASDPLAVARIAHRSEVTEFGSPGGMMDHYSTAVGGVIWLDCGEPPKVQQLPPWASDFVLVDSRIPKDTNGVLRRVRWQAESLGVDLESLPAWEEIPKGVLAGFTEPLLPILEANVRNRDLTRHAKGLLLGAEDAAGLGALLDAHHEQLSRNLGVSVPEIDALLDMGRQCGALGGKINGSGGGGSFFFFSPGKARDIAGLFLRTGYRAWPVKVAKGLEVTIEDAEN